MRLLVTGLLLLSLNGASAQRYLPPSGNCDAAVMQLEAARTANAKSRQELPVMIQHKDKVCSAGIKTAEQRVSTANRLSERASGLLMACPGMDDAMAQGEKMAAFSRTEVLDAAKSLEELHSSCGQVSP